MKTSFLLICYLLILIGVLDFHLWGQVVNMNEYEQEIGVFTHPHGLRYVLTFPIFLVSDWIGIHYDVLFHIISPLFLLTITVLCLEIVSFFRYNLTNKQKRLVFYSLSILFISTSAFMNGRMLFSLTGFSIIVFTMIYWHLLTLRKTTIFFVFGLMLMSVSSGTFVIGIGSICIFMLSDSRIRNNFPLILGCIVGFFFLYPVIEIMVNKNIDYYGSVYLMAEHGFLSKVNAIDNEILWLTFFSFFFFLLIQLFIINLYKRYIVLIIPFVMSIGVGMFGYSALTMSLIPLSILFHLCLLRCSDGFPRVCRHD